MLLQRQKDLVSGIEWRIKPRTVDPTPPRIRSSRR
jgi:hypothetical protein